MLLTLAVVVLLTAIFALFSDEIAHAVGRMKTIPGVSLLVPLFVVSLGVFYFQDMLLWISMMVRNTLNAWISQGASLLPSPFNHEIFLVILGLVCLAVLPSIIITVWRRYKILPPFEYHWVLSSFLWGTFALIYVAR